MEADVVPNRFFRLVKTYPPDESEFLSYRQLNVELAREVPDPLMLDGVSVFDSLRFLVRRARQSGMNRHGQYVVEMVPVAGVSVHKTGGRHHYTLLGTPSALLDSCTGLVGSIEDLEPIPKEFE